LTIIAFIVAVAAGLFQSISNPRGSLIGIAGLAVILIIFAIGYNGMGSDPGWMQDGPLREFEVSESQSKIINGGMTTVAGMGLIAILAFIGSEIRNFFK
jgi:hypothetical protein